MNAPSIPELIKAERQAKGLSQRALGAKVGLPQSHISKIESGAVDLQISSLIEIARALGLELALVPRSALPAIQALQRQSSGASGAADELVLEKLRSLEKRAAATARRYPKAKVLEQLVRMVRQLDTMPVGRLSAERILQLTTTLAEIEDRLRRIDKSSGDGPAESVLEEIAIRLEKLRLLRDSLAHGLTDQASMAVPAYRLDGGDEGDV